MSQENIFVGKQYFCSSQIIDLLIACLIKLFCVGVD